MSSLDKDFVEALFPTSKTDDFFEALFGDKEDGAYDIKLTLQEDNDYELYLHYELHGRPGKCLACNLTSGLPHVFQRHPIIASKATAEILAKEKGWGNFEFEIGKTEQVSDALHFIPLTIFKA